MKFNISQSSSFDGVYADNKNIKEEAHVSANEEPLSIICLESEEECEEEWLVKWDEDLIGNDSKQIEG